MSPSSKTLAAVEEAPAEEPAAQQDGVTYLPIRGKVYRIEELSQKEYEAQQRRAEIPDKDNEGSTVTDMILLERLVALKSVTIVEKEGDPAGQPLEPDAWASEKFPVTSRVQWAVRQAHYMALTDQQLAEIAKAETEKGKATPNG